MPSRLESVSRRRDDVAEEDAMTYRRTRYACVYWRGDSLYFTFRDERRQKQEVRFGAGSPLEASRAQQAAQERADLIRSGRLDPATEAAGEWSRTPIGEQIVEYRHHLEAVGDSPAHVKTVVAYLDRWSASCGVGSFAVADPGRAVRWLSDQGWSARSRNYARSSILGFCRWAAEYHRLANPCPAALVPKSSESADPRRPSRALAPAEIVYLLASVRAPDRRAFYAIAIYTGIRWRELRRLDWRGLDLGAGLIVVSAGQSKTGKAAELPLAARAARALDRWHAHLGRPASGPIFDREPRVKTWWADLDRARARWIARGASEAERSSRASSTFLARLDERGRQADRKACRLTFGTLLKSAGVDLRDAQRLLRHSDPKLTSNIYTDPRLADLRAGVDRLSTTNQPERATLGGKRRHFAS